jgi:KipI family sensor histidine kinase inhibitor
MGERAVLLEVADQAEVHFLWSALRAAQLEGVEDVVGGGASVLIVTRVGAPLDELTQRVITVSTARTRRPTSRDIVIPVVYDGPDLADVAAITGLNTHEIIGRHAGSHYEVAFVGFSPGFAYLTGPHPSLHVPRLETPRKVVPAGSVALAAGMSAIYPQATPGGWRIIGRTDRVMFDPTRAQPSLLAPGDRVRFEPRTDLPRLTEPVLKAEVFDGTPGESITVLESGPHSTVQDRGRIGWAHVGVPRAGALDAASAHWANRLVGNPPDAAVLEVAFGGLRAVLGPARRVAVTGARADVTVDGLPARQDTGLYLPRGAEMVIGRVRAGVRVYVAVEGGIATAPVLGSQATDTLSGLGPRSLEDGDIVPLGPPGSGPPRLTVGPAPAAGGAARHWYPAPDDLIEVQALIGPRSDRISSIGLERLAAAEFVVNPTSDRTGIRLDGPAVERANPSEVPSQGMVPGAIQIPPDGKPIVLMRNHPSTGGYPVAAVVGEAGVDRLAQAAPGVRVRFRMQKAR